VSCTSAAFCEALGTGFALGWNGTAWVRQATSLDGLGSVSCASAPRPTPARRSALPITAIRWW